MARTYLVFGDIDGKLDVLRVECARCQRKGRYSVRRLIEKYGRNANMMKWKEQLNGDCPRRDAPQMHDRCDLVCLLGSSVLRCSIRATLISSKLQGAQFSSQSVSISCEVAGVWSLRRTATRGKSRILRVRSQTHPCLFAAMQESAHGIVSRVTPVHTAVRNCTRDEGRSFEVGNQVLISSHRKLLSSKAMVVNVAEKSEQDFDRHD